MTPTPLILSRNNKIREAIRNADLHALVLNPGPSLTYLTGLHFHLSERPTVALFLPDQDPILILPELETAKVRALPFVLTAYPYGEDPDTWVEVIKQAAQDAKLNEAWIGIESRWLRFLELQLLEQAIPGAHFFPADRVIASLRMYKDDQEIADMQRAVDIAQKALQAILPSIKPGRTEAEIAAELSVQLLRHGSNPNLPFFPIVSTGPNSANPHAAPSGREIRSGDLLVIDYGANVNGYYSDITRTFAIGDVDPECFKIAEIVLAANQAGRQAIVPGVMASRVDAASRGIIEKAGYGDYFIHRTGHGLGLEVHEEPYIRGDNEMALQTGMTFTIEPGIYLPDRFGVRIEDNVVVTPEGVRCLTSLPRELLKLPLT